MPGNTWGRSGGGQSSSYVPAAEDLEEVKEETLSFLKSGKSGVSDKYVVKDTEFSSYPEITPRTVEKLKT